MGIIARHQDMNDANSVGRHNGSARAIWAVMHRRKKTRRSTLIVWQNGKSLTWDVTDACSTGESYISDSASRPGSAVEKAAIRITAKYAQLTEYMFQPLECSKSRPMTFLTVMNKISHRNRVILVNDPSFTKGYRLFFSALTLSS